MIDVVCPECPCVDAGCLCRPALYRVSFLSTGLLESSIDIDHHCLRSDCLYRASLFSDGLDYVFDRNWLNLVCFPSKLQ